MTYNGPLPDIDDALTAPYWHAAREHRLTAQQCQHCQSLRWQPSPICPECLHPGGTWVDLSGRGQIYSAVRYHRAMHPDFKSLVPYTVALITLDEGLDMYGMIEGPVQPNIGDRVKAQFLDATANISLVMWAPDPMHGQ